MPGEYENAVERVPPQIGLQRWKFCDDVLRQRIIESPAQLKQQPPVDDAAGLDQFDSVQPCGDGFCRKRRRIVRQPQARRGMPRGEMHARGVKADADCAARRFGKAEPNFALRRIFMLPV